MTALAEPLETKLLAGSSADGYQTFQETLLGYWQKIKDNAQVNYFPCYDDTWKPKDTNLKHKTLQLISGLRCCLDRYFQETHEQ